jgi:hypothetical protein
MELVTVFFGVGLSWANLGGSYTNPSRSGAVDVSVARVRDPHLAVGGHLRASHVDGWVGDRGGSGGVDTSYDFYTFDVAGTLQLTAGPVVFSPWVGLHVVAGTAVIFSSDQATPSRQRDIDRPHLAAGALLAIDLAQPVAVYGELQAVAASGDDPGTDTFAFTLGVAYRR